MSADIFISYARDDRNRVLPIVTALERKGYTLWSDADLPVGEDYIFTGQLLQTHLRPLEREGVVVWDDTRLRPGEPWREEIRKAMTETKVAILLVSADFLASDFIATDELPPLLKAAEEDGATILPVIISPSGFRRMESLSRFQAVNDPEKPLVQLRRGNREKVLDQVAGAVQDALKR